MYYNAKYHCHPYILSTVLSDMYAYSIVNTVYECTRHGIYKHTVLIHREQSGTFTHLPGKPKPTACDGSASSDSLPALTVTVTLVVLV